MAVIWVKTRDTKPDRGPQLYSPVPIFVPVACLSLKDVDISDDKLNVAVYDKPLLPNTRAIALQVGGA